MSQLCQKYKSIQVILFLCLFSSCSSQVEILTSEEAPGSYLKNGEVVGITVDVVEEIQRMLGTNNKIKLESWESVYKKAKHKNNVIVFTAGKTRDREKLGFKFLGPIILKNHMLVKKRGSVIKVKGLDDIRKRKLTVAGVRNDWRSDFLIKKGVNVYETRNHIDGIKMLLEGKVDLWITADMEVFGVLRKMGLDHDAISHAHDIRMNKSYIMISKETSEQVVNDWYNAFSKLQSSDYLKKISKKWSYILDEKICYSKINGFYTGKVCED